ISCSCSKAGAASAAPEWCRHDGAGRACGAGGGGGVGGVKSMTGFAALTREDERATIAVTIRTVNHRHLDLQLRSPQSLSAIEAELRALVASRVSRGRIELSVALQFRQTRGVDVEFNEDFARALEIALDKARE